MTPCHTRALLGYFREIFFSTPAQQADTRQQLTDFATREGYALHSILFERLDTRPAAFERLVELAKRDSVTTVAVSCPDDLEDGQRQRLAVEAGAHVVVAGGGCDAALVGLTNATGGSQYQPQTQSWPGLGSSDA